MASLRLPRPTCVFSPPPTHPALPSSSPTITSHPPRRPPALFHDHSAGTPHDFYPLYRFPHNLIHFYNKHAAYHLSLASSVRWTSTSVAVSLVAVTSSKPRRSGSSGVSSSHSYWSTDTSTSTTATSTTDTSTSTSDTSTTTSTTTSPTTSTSTASSSTPSTTPSSTSTSSSINTTTSASTSPVCVTMNFHGQATTSTQRLLEQPGKGGPGGDMRSMTAGSSDTTHGTYAQPPMRHGGESCDLAEYSSYAAHPQMQQGYLQDYNPYQAHPNQQAQYNAFQQGPPQGYAPQAAYGAASSGSPSQQQTPEANTSPQRLLSTVPAADSYGGYVDEPATLDPRGSLPSYMSLWKVLIAQVGHHTG
ncbi:hypothetical protein DICSQDRAFT_170921 [Dichomitus squalens LYAD-421 SS1]|uniref:Uncharacterized protein n=1 Tax=Dichomitus squalens (strain LYAD-421) TaxID=732165 RepID=R7T0S8_DICSQ|nr:uncharacterized protein DICSQDRAFT_170921 [Dichomitus squalens LYAD-421 SS1]EJF60777.1 hypothetical protein DICSQDRAFT_170921 [Dichomitus squalens LYAD-421 SS1]